MAILPEGVNIFGGLGKSMSTLLYIVVGIVAFVVVGSITALIIYRRLQNKKFNIPLIIITPRSDGTVAEINKGVGGYFKTARVGGITQFRVKRKGIGVVDIPPPASSFLTAPNKTLILAQKGVDDYEPVMPSSLLYVEVPGVNHPVMILKLKAINQDATAWSFDNAESAKKRFTFASIWEKYQMLISMMIFIFILFLILYINWMGMKDVVSGLKDVVDALHGSPTPIITPGG